MVSYSASWDSLDQHRAPEWYDEAKFGLFIHYSPSWFGEDDELPVPHNYDPEEWADLATTAGMRYVLFTSKHHDGFSNWPTQLSDFAAEDFFSERDIVTPLVEAVRERGLKMGFYYSWLDRHHPEYPDREGYVRDFAHEQMRELCDLYRPSILWGDGEWDHSADHWGAEEFAAWYYNDAEEREQDVALNDRLGEDTRYFYVHGLNDPDGDGTGGDPHGDYWTPEHQTVDGVLDHKWETCETMHDGWAWEEDPNWRDPGDLVRLLADVVSKNGNLLLNVGPRPDGSISDREKEIVEEMGAWLDVNGEAIYGTRPYADPDSDATFAPRVDWENPDDTWERLVEHVDGEGPLRYTRRDHTVYAIHFGQPEDDIRLHGLTLRDGADVELLGHGPVESRADGDDVVAEAPSDLPCDHAVAFKVPHPVRNR